MTAVRLCHPASHLSSERAASVSADKQNAQASLSLTQLFTQNPPANVGDTGDVQSLGQDDPLE